MLVGAGKRLFSEQAPAAGLEVVASSTTRSGATYTAFTPGPFTTGRFEVEDGRETEQL